MVNIVRVNGKKSGRRLADFPVKARRKRKKCWIRREECTSKILVYDFYLARIKHKASPEVEGARGATAVKPAPEVYFTTKYQCDSCD
jgi:hypothetical protein